MADANLQDFGKRLNKLNSKHRKMAQGYLTSVNHDGLIIARPRRRGPRFPVKGLMLALVALFGLKGFLYVNLGPITYTERVGKLESGTIVEQFGAFAMQADPVTLWVADQIRTILN